MKHFVPHDLTLEQACQVARKAFEHYRERYAKYHPRLTWSTETKAEASFRAKGLTVRATIELLPHGVAVDLKVPFLFRIFRSRAEAVVRREVRYWCAQVDEAPT
jgi:hypothetical protein